MSREGLLGIEDVGDPTAHAGREVAAGLAEHDHGALGHVLAAVIAHSLDDRSHAAVADAEALAGHAAEEHLAAGRSVERDVADDDVLLGHEGRAFGGMNDDPSAGHALAEVVVGVALETDRDSVGEERSEALTGGAAEVDLDRFGRQALRTVASRDLRREHRADGPVHVPDRQRELDRRPSAPARRARAR